MGNKTSTTPSRPIRRRLTLIILLLFVSSAALRIAGFGAAWATANDDTMMENVFGTDSCKPNDTFMAMIEDLNAREDRLYSAEIELEAKRTDIEVSRKAILAQLKVLEEAETRLEEKLAVSSAASETDLAQLTSVYQAMKPKVAAELFEAMDPEFAAGFLVRMTPEAAADIVSGMDPAIAYAISVIVAGRNAEALKE